MRGLLAGVAIAAIGAAVFFSGCGKGNATASGGGSGGAAGAGSGGTKYKVAGIIFQDDQFFRLIKFGMEDEAAKVGVELVEGNSNNKREEEQQLVENFQTQKVDAIIISPLDAHASVAALQDAHDKGIVVVTNNSAIDADFPEGSVECSASDLGDQTGKAAVKYINDKLGGKANIAVLAFDSQVPEQSKARTGGFLKEVQQLPGVNIVIRQDAWLTDKAQSVAGDILTAHPEINLIYAANEGGTNGAVLAVQSAGKGGKVAVFGTDVSENLLGFLLSPDDILQAITAQKPFEVGQESVDIALAAIKKEPHEKKMVLNGILLSRADPDGVKAYAGQLKTWTAGGK